MANHLAITSAEQVERALEEARAYCEEHGRILTWARLAFCCGVDRNTLTKYRDGVVKMDEVGEGVKQEIMGALKRAWAECNAELEEVMMEKGNCVGAIFLGKNNYGYADKVEVKADVGVTFVGEEKIPD